MTKVLLTFAMLLALSWAVDAQRSRFIPTDQVATRFASTAAGGATQNTVYFMGDGVGAPSTTAAVRSIRVPPNRSRVVAVVGWASHTNAPSTETVTWELRKNADAGSDVVIGTYTYGQAQVGASGVWTTEIIFTGLNYTVTPGDKLDIVINNPVTFATAPANLTFAGNVIFE